MPAKAQNGDMLEPAKVNFLYTNIGRGHPFYLDGIIESLVRRGDIGLVRGERDVFDLSRGLSLAGWRLARWLYRRGSSGGVVGHLYSYLRSNGDYNRSGLMLRLLGRHIRRAYEGDTSPLVVAHPTLAAIMRDRAEVIYQHGEVAVPKEALVRGVSKVLVPDRAAGEAFAGAGYADDDVIITGLCVEPALVKQASDAFRLRRERLESGGPLTGAYFSSGAEPKPHLNQLLDAAVAAVRSGDRAIIFARQGGNLARRAFETIVRYGLESALVDRRGPFPGELPPVMVVTYTTRREEAAFTAQLFARFDYFVAPAHERTNWGLGLGLPMFLLGPDIGSFAALNRRRLEEAGVARGVDGLSSAKRFGEMIAGLGNDGELLRMAEAGWERLPIDGFQKIAGFLTAKYSPKVR